MCLDASLTHLFANLKRVLRLKMKYVYFFGAGKADGTGDMRDLLGGKGAGLAEMTRIGLPVPAGFTLPTDTCVYFLKHGRKYPSALRGDVEKSIARLEKLTAKKPHDAY